MASLTVDEFRQHVTTALGDEAVTRILAAAWTAIIEVAGDVDDDGHVTEFVNGGGTFLILTRATTVDDIVSIKEWTGFSYERTLAADDYRLRADGRSLQRLITGTNVSPVFIGPTEVVYTPTEDDARRQMAQVQLAQLYLDHHPGVTSETIGDWSESFAGGGDEYAAERDAILASLRAPNLGFA